MRQMAKVLVEICRNSQNRLLRIIRILNTAKIGSRIFRGKEVKADFVVWHMAFASWPPHSNFDAIGNTLT